MGKIGLPLALKYSSVQNRVTGIDIDEGRVREINRGVEPFPGEEGLLGALSKELGSGRFSATADFKAVSESDVVVVVVPLGLDEHEGPDFAALDNATRAIGLHLRKGALVLFETTVPVGTTRNRVTPILEAASGMVEGEDFFVAFSPERVLSGRIFRDLSRYPKLIGGVSRGGAQRAAAFYESVLDFEPREDLARENGVWDLGSAESAEFAKLAETSYRDVNIALANQFAHHAEQVGVNIYSVIEACNSQQFSQIHQPGISVGGHCIPVYPHLYLSTDPSGGVVEAARQYNSGMPSRAVSEIQSIVPLADTNVLILGLAYRPGVKEHAHSGAFELTSALKNRGAIVSVADPLYSDEEIASLGLEPYSEFFEPEILVLHTAHHQFASFSGEMFPSVKIVFDGRNSVEEASWPNASVLTLGIPHSSE